jgi:hypothetical protein
MRCLIYRWMISRAADGDRTLSPTARKHVETCPSCRAFCRQSSEIARQLRSDAWSEEESLSHGVRFRILSRLGLENRAQPQRITAPVLRLTLAATVGLVLVLGALWLVGWRGGQRTDAPPVGPAPSLALPEFAGANPLDGDMPLSLAGEAEEPLKQEMDSLVADTVSATAFLADCVMVGATGS